jgi:predicted transcriptional regulator
MRNHFAGARTAAKAWDKPIEVIPARYSAVRACLGSDYPMVAPNYAAARSHLAKQMGLGQQRRHK